MTQSEIEKAAEDYAKREPGTIRIPLPYSDSPGRNGQFELDDMALIAACKAAFLAGAEHAKQAERFRIVQLISNLPDGSITNTTWGEIARLIAAPEGESK